MVDFYAITVATNEGGYYNCLKHSCKINNIKLVTLGWNQKWKGFVWRWKLYINFLNKLNNDDIVMWVDAYDVLVLGKKELIIDRFKSFNKGIVLGVSKSLKYMNMFGECDGHIYNGGNHIGYVKYVKILANMMVDSKLALKWNNDDQHVLNYLKCTNPFLNDHAVGDYNSKIFFIFGVFDTINKSYLIDNKINLGNSDPLVLHGTGGTNMDYYARKLGCDMSKIAKVNKVFKAKQLYNIVKNSMYINSYYFLIIGLILIIIIIAYRGNEKNIIMNR